MLKLGKKLKCTTLSNLKKIAKSVTGEKLKFMGETFINIFFKSICHANCPKFLCNGLDGRV